MFEILKFWKLCNIFVTSDNVHPEEEKQGARKKRKDLETYYDEADYIVPQQVEAAIHKGNKIIKVISVDTDISVILCHHYLKRNWSQAEVYLKYFSGGSRVINIKKTVEKHSDIVTSFTAVHAISSCISVPAIFNIGKKKALSVLKKMPLNFFGKIESEKNDVLQEGKLFVSKLYGMKDPFSFKNKLLRGLKKTNIFRGCT